MQTLTCALHALHRSCHALGAQTVDAVHGRERKTEETSDALRHEESVARHESTFGVACVRQSRGPLVAVLDSSSS